MSRQSFRGEILTGHKGDAVVVPFDPAKVWSAEPAAVPPPWRRGYLVRGTLNQHAFEGWIGFRWGRFFILVDDELQRAAGVSAGDEVDVIVEPRRKATLAVSRKPKPPAVRLPAKKRAPRDRR